MGDGLRLDQVASLPRLQEMLAGDPSLIDTAGPAALARAMYWRNGEPIVRFLLDKGARLDHPPGIFGPVHEAVWNDRVESVLMVLEAGASIRRRSPSSHPMVAWPRTSRCCTSAPGSVMSR